MWSKAGSGLTLGLNSPGSLPVDPCLWSCRVISGAHAELSCHGRCWKRLPSALPPKIVPSCLSEHHVLSFSSSKSLQPLQLPGDRAPLAQPDVPFSLCPRRLLLSAWFPSNVDVSSQFSRLGWAIVWAAVVFHSVWPPKNWSLESIWK